MKCTVLLFVPLPLKKSEIGALLGMGKVHMDSAKHNIFPELRW